jgi:hypothetical protein
MQKDTDTALPISGWLILAAAALLIMLNTSVNTLLQVVGSTLTSALMYGQGLPETMPAFAIIIIFCAVSLPVGIRAALLFFRRSRSFFGWFAALIAIQCAYNILSFVSFTQNGYPMGAGQSLGFAVTFILGLGLIVYFLVSRRVKKTFLFGSAEHTLSQKQEPPYMIGGFLVVVVLRLADILSGSFYSVFNNIENLFSAFDPSALLLAFAYALACVLAAIAMLLCFHRRKAFKWMFVILAGVFFMYDAYTLVSFAASSPDAALLPWYFYIPTAIYYTYYVAVIVYMLISGRVKNTFVYGIRDPLPHCEKLVNSPLFPPDDDIDAAGTC